jgi:septal ring factor EnvC (AmiA/AmiB activator)
MEFNRTFKLKDGKVIVRTRKKDGNVEVIKYVTFDNRESLEKQLNEVTQAKEVTEKEIEQAKERLVIYKNDIKFFNKTLSKLPKLEVKEIEGVG